MLANINDVVGVANSTKCLIGGNAVSLSHVFISTLGNGVDFGDLPASSAGTAAISSTHGGLQ